MELLKKARDELRRMRDQFLNLVDPNHLHVQVETVLHHAVEEIERLHALVANFETRVQQIEHAAEVRVHEALVRAGLAKPEDAPLRAGGIMYAPPPSDESAAPGGAPAEPSAPSSPAAGSEASDTSSDSPPVISIPLSAELQQNIAAADPAPSP